MGDLAGDFGGVGGDEGGPDAGGGAPPTGAPPVMNTPALNPVPTAFEKASLAAKRLASVPALVKGRRLALARSISVNTRSSKRSPKRASEFSIRSMLQRSEPMPMIMR